MMQITHSLVSVNKLVRVMLAANIARNMSRHRFPTLNACDSPFPYLYTRGLIRAWLNMTRVEGVNMGMTYFFPC